MKAITKIFDRQPLRLDNVAKGLDNRIRTVAVLNNTPFFLYVGREQNVGRESALFVVEPYSDVRMPVSESQALYVNEGPAIGVIPGNCQATILWGSEVCEMASRKAHRTVVIPVWSGRFGAAPVTAYMTAQGGYTDTTAPGGLSAQGGNLGGGTVTSSTGQQLYVFAVPASATRRTLYLSADVTSLTLEGSIDGETWFVLGTFTETTALSEAFALPPYLRAKISGGDGKTGSVQMVVDL